MAGAPGRASPHTGAARSDDLLATKFYVPRPEPGFVPRPRLLERLDVGLTGALCVVCAAPGSGKTALLADWARQGGHTVAWLTVDGGDNDPARFWRSVTAALDRLRPGVARWGSASGGPPSFSGELTALINDLAADPGDGEVVLILDDYHLIESAAVHEVLGFLLEHRPAGLHLVVAGRADPPLPLARLRARGQLTEVRDADLRCTAPEAEALLREAVVLTSPLPEGAARALADRTEGWVAGLKLAALSLRGRDDVAGFVATFGGTHRYVLDFLTEEVLDRQPEPVRRFLLETSVLDRLSGELCDAVTGRGGGQRMLESIERAHLFLVPLDEERGWWRYHQLFADLLRARLQQEEPERVPALHHEAAEWCARHGLVDDALRHALAAGDSASGARLIERHVDERILRSEQATVERWLASLPDDLVRSRPRLLVAQALLALVSMHLDDVEASLDAAERVADLAETPFESSVGPSRSLVANVPAMLAFERAFLAELRGDVGAMITYGRRALAELGGSRTTLGAVITGHLGVAEWLSGRLDEAERMLDTSITELRSAGEAFLAVRMCDSLGQVQRARGDLDAARSTYLLARRSAAPQVLPAAGIAAVGLAEVAYQRNQLDDALAQLTEGIAACRHLAYTQPLAAGLALLARIRQAQGDAPGARAAMDEARSVVPSPGRASLLNPVPAQRARLLLAQGHVGAAARWTASCGVQADDELRYAREPEYLVLARVLLAQDRPEQALGLLARLERLAEAQQRTAGLIEIRMLRAVALAACGAGPGALDPLAEALRLGARAGFVRVFTDEGPPLQVLIRRLVTRPASRDVPADHLGRVLRAFEPATGAPAGSGGPCPADVPGLVETLSSREIEVLRLLAAGRRNREIAEELVVELSTVKKHVTHILQKLGAANRTGAAARARAYGLLP